MRRNTLNFVVDLVSLLAMVGLVVTGLVMRFLLPPGTGGRFGHGPGKVLWGLGRHDWGDVHFWIAVAIVALMLLHVLLHWAWVCGTVRRLIVRDRASENQSSSWSRNLYGLAFLLVIAGLLGAFFLTARANVKTRAGDGPGEASEPADLGHHGGATHLGGGWGSKTLADLERESGVPVPVILEELGLPATTSPDEHLGRLRNKYGFTMAMVRDIIARHQTEDVSADQ